MLHLRYSAQHKIRKEKEKKIAKTEAILYSTVFATSADQ